jgi:DNA-binding NarL/FixJ family response regulator
LYHFDENLVRQLRAGQELLSAEIGNGHYALYDRLRRVVGGVMKADAFLVALFRDEDHVLFAYQYDGAIYALPGVRKMNPDGPTGWVYASKRSYTYSLDGGEVLNRGVSWGEEDRPSLDALFVPMRRTNSDEIIGVVSAQAYTAGSYGKTELAALEWLTELLARILSAEDEQRYLIRSLDYRRSSPGRTATKAITDLVIERVDVVRRSAVRLAEALENDGHALVDSAREVVRECERLQIDSAELEFDDYRESAYRFGTLSRREREVGRLLAEGLTNDEIRARLHIELPTVKTHVGSILKKYGAHQRSTVAAEISAYLASR